MVQYCTHMDYRKRSAILEIILSIMFSVQYCISTAVYTVSAPASTYCSNSINLAKRTKLLKNKNVSVKNLLP